MIERKTKRIRQKGFTLIELAIVLGVIAILTAFFLPGMLKAREDSKLSTAITQLQKDFPGAIARQVSRTNTCSTTTITAAKLKERGLPDLTVWNTAWTVDAVTSNQVTISYTL
ncbi:prepilin-type N-terminal cleavage/methylation domain-containing protein, partial [Pseudomonas aeruginosa]|nr:prepilin-type N-terminal cleavage/methylation domain-containing protein [Pseudomonas aeruginosa]